MSGSSPISQPPLSSLLFFVRVYTLMTTPYPVLNGLTYSVIKRIIGGNTLIAKAGSGREVRVGLWSNPEWEWDLTYEYLPDKVANGTTSSDLKQLMGFIGANMGALIAFPFMDPDDNTVLGQLIATGDGVTASFYLTRTYGLSAGTTSYEPIGYLDNTYTTKVYVNGVLKTLTTDYTLSTATPYFQKVNFISAPAAAAAITVDMRYYFMARIKDDSVEFEKFMDKLWALKKITLVSLKGS
jgi:uncharacterized protein (TIGR02217 family)